MSPERDDNLVALEAPASARRRRSLPRPTADAVMVAVLLAGIVLLSVGAWMAWPPAGLLTAGAFLVVLPLAWARGGWASSTG